MAIIVTSTTDPKAASDASKSVLAEKVVSEEKKSASSEEKSIVEDETVEASDASEDTVDEDKSEAEESQDESESDGEETKEDERPKKKNGFKKRIDKLTQRISAKDQELEYWKAEALKGKSPEKPEPVVEKKPALEGKPKADDFETHEDFVEALTDWKLETKEKERESKAKETQLKTDYQSQSNEFKKKCREFSEANDGFRDAVEDVDDILMSPGLQEIVLSSDSGPALLYELAKNRDEYERINALGPLSAAREIGKIEARLVKKNEKPNEKKTTNAPAPIAPVGSKGGKIKKSIDDPNLSQAEYEKLRREQMKASGA